MDKAKGYFGQGQRWKHQRKFLQADLLSPYAARGYIPWMIQVVKVASNGLADFCSDVNEFMVLTTFNMFPPWCLEKRLELQIQNPTMTLKTWNFASRWKRDLVQYTMKADPESISEKDLAEIRLFLLAASVDTTLSFLN
jgi:cytochrome P450